MNWLGLDGLQLLDPWFLLFAPAGLQLPHDGWPSTTACLQLFQPLQGAEQGFELANVAL